MAIEWTPDLATGSDHIDEQHKELFHRVNQLLEACRQGKGKEEVKHVVKFLDDYVVTHFSAEEAYMRNYNYPEYPGHKKQHLEFMENFSNLKSQIEKEGAGVHLIVKANQLIVDWLKNHIRKVDKELGTFLKTRT